MSAMPCGATVPAPDNKAVVFPRGYASTVALRFYRKKKSCEIRFMKECIEAWENTGQRWRGDDHRTWLCRRSILNCHLEGEANEKLCVNEPFAEQTPFPHWEEEMVRKQGK